MEDLSEFFLFWGELTETAAASFKTTGHLKVPPEPMSSHDSHLYVVEMQHQKCQNSYFFSIIAQNMKLKTHIYIFLL